MVTDRFGTNWMLLHQEKQTPSPKPPPPPTPDQPAGCGPHAAARRRRKLKACSVSRVTVRPERTESGS
ncbi:MAG: hypothetical protein ACYCW6_05620 [Candidatus Xenobia bacterium]